MRKTILMTFFATFLAVAVHGQAIERLSAQYLRFDVTETVCVASIFFGCPPPIAGGTGGKLVYSHPIFVPALSGAPVLYVSFAAQGDQHGGAAEYLSCNIDGLLCNAGTGGAGGAPTGWVNVQHYYDYQRVTYCSSAVGLSSGCGLSSGDGSGGTGDHHDNTIYAHWCVHVTPGTHTVNLRMATGPIPALGNPAVVSFFEAAHIFIDASQPPPGSDCTRAPDL